MRKIFNICFIFTMLLCSCRKDKSINTDYLVFGHFFGMCAGESCIEIFKLTETNLYEDTNDKYPYTTDFYQAKYIGLDSKKFDLVKDLRNSFPTDLFKEKNHVIGQPDAGDWGGYYIEYKSKGVHQFWLIDKMRSNVPAQYQDFLDRVDAKITLLQ